MKQGIFTITENRVIVPGILHLLRMRGDASAVTMPGQFVNIRAEGFFLRRPFSVCDREGDELTVVYKIIGGGTEKLAGMQPGETLDVLTGLGNGFDTAVSGERPLLVGGGSGVPPFYMLCRAFLSEGKHPLVVMGFNTAAEVFFEAEFRALGAELIITTADGSYGRAGLATDIMDELQYTHIYACGPEPMLRAVDAAARTDGQFSFDARMGCGFGACMGCTSSTKSGPARVCKEGPVFRRGELAW